MTYSSPWEELHTKAASPFNFINIKVLGNIYPKNFSYIFPFCIEMIDTMFYHVIMS